MEGIVPADELAYAVASFFLGLNLILGLHVQVSLRRFAIFAVGELPQNVGDGIAAAINWCYRNRSEVRFPSTGAPLPPKIAADS